MYDSNGDPFGFKYNNTEYYYVKNAQNDVTAITDSAGKVIANYYYDAWGKLLSVTDANGKAITASTNVAIINPIRYRSYYYDTETGYYYLSSRYYSPDMCRFLNADSEIADVGGDILGYNMFAYCMNSPVNMTDPIGNWPTWISGALNTASGILQMAAGAALGATVGWTGFGAVVAGFLFVNGAATTTQGVGQIVNDVTKSKVMREDNIIRTGVKSVGHAIGGQTGASVAGLAYDAFTVASSIYAGTILKGSSACFVAGTAVLTSIGSKAIEKIEAGDRVWATDPETGETELKEVVQTFVNEANELVHITVNNEKIVCTNEHPFYSPVKGWVEACDLRAGDILVSVNGEYVVVEKVEHEILEAPIKVYNFEVEDFHTYYVGNRGLLVHNTCGGYSGSKASLPKDGTRVNSSKALDMAEDFLGPGYTEASPGRFVSADGYRQVRMGDMDILGSHAGGPHINFELITPSSLRSGRYKIDKVHIYIFD